MDNNQIRELIKNLRITMRCPRCGKKYNLEEIFLKRSVGTTHFLQLNCSNCRTPVYATIAVNGNLAQMAKPKPMENKKPIQIEKSISADKSAPTTKKSNITTDDVIEMHTFLDKHQGKLSDIL